MRATLGAMTTAAVLASGCGLIGGAGIQEENVEEHGDVIDDVESRVGDIEEQQRDRYPTPDDEG